MFPKACTRSSPGSVSLRAPTGRCLLCAGQMRVVRNVCLPNSPGMKVISPRSSVRKPVYKHAEAASTPCRRHPEIQHPPDDYSLIEADLHRATTSLEVSSFPFLSQLKLRSAINLSAEPLHDRAYQFFLAAGVSMLNPRSLDGFDGPYDLWEEAVKELLQLLLDASNYPMILLDSPTECESACLVGCLRRLQHWSMVAINDEYHMMTMRNTRYSMSQVFIERFDLDLVTLKSTDNLPPWYRKHLRMLEEERVAEEDLSRRDPDRPTRAWVHGVFSCSPSSIEPTEKEEDESDINKDRDNDSRIDNKSGEGTARERATAGDAPGPPTAAPTWTPTWSPAQQTEAAQNGRVSLPESGTSRSGELNAVEVAERSDGANSRAPAKAGGEHAEPSTQEVGGAGAGAGGFEGEAEEDGSGSSRREDEVEKTMGVVPDFRLNGFVYVCPLVSEGCTFTAKAWLQDEDD